MGDAVAFMIGTSALVLGISFLARSKDWVEWLKRLQHLGPPTALMIGYMHLISGTFIVGFHWKWTGLPLLTTLIGVKAIVEGCIYTIFPNSLLRMLAWYVPRSRVLFHFAGVITLVIGVAVLCEWQQSTQTGCEWKPCFDQAPNALLDDR